MISQFLETINGALTISFLGLEFFFFSYIGCHIYARMKEFGWVDGFYLGYRERRGAISMSIVVLGEIMIRGAIWAWRHFEINDKNTLITAIVNIGVFVTLIGVTCALRHFAPVRFGRWPLLIPVVGLAVAAFFAL